MDDYSIYVYLNIILICSFIGFIMENVWLIFRYGYFDNRNMNIPFLLGYGLAVVAIYKLIGIPKEMPDIKYFATVFLLVSAGEILLGKTVEKVCHIYYWDYSKLPLHLTRYTSLFTSIGFALAISIFMRNCFPKIAYYLSANESVTFEKSGMLGCIVIFLDYVYSFGKMAKEKRLNQKWRVDVMGDKELRERA